MEHEMRATAHRVGTVTALQTGPRVRVRVKFLERDQMVSWWLDTPNYYKPEIGDVVICHMDLRDEDGIVVGAIAPDKFSWWPKDGAQFYYDAVAHKLNLLFSDEAVVSYDAASHALTKNLPAGATISISISGGGSISYDGGGWKIEPGAGKVLLADAAGGTQPVARIGDTVHVTDDEGGTLVGNIVTGSSKVSAGG